MSGSGSEHVAQVEADQDRPYTEHDERRTHIEYDRGGVPAYIIAAWIAFILAYVGVMAALALPDLRAWMAR